MYFIDLDQCHQREVIPGVKITTTWGDRVMMSFVDFEPHSEVPAHDHPHEQMGMVLDGEFEFTIGGETRIVSAGDCYCVPSGIVHSVKVGDGPARALDIFSPPREDYQPKAG